MSTGRDRRGRGRRGPLAWPAVPTMVSRAVAFDELVLDCAQRYEGVLGARWADVELAVADVPPTDPAPWEDGPALARIFPAEGAHPHRVVVYRRPVETLAAREGDLASVVELVVARQLAELLGVDVEDIDPELG
ncbi:metallopeptidase family protein [Janibacter melonis]|nr:metallopeptidase family protein [Janibacter melonis]